MHGDNRNAAPQLSLCAVLYLPRQLAACRVDIMAACFSNGRNDAAIHQRALKSDDACTRRRPELRSRKRIERYQVDLARHVAQERKQRAGGDRIVVDAVEHYIFERDEIARGLFDVPAARGEQLIERMLAIDRYETIAPRVVR